MAARPGVRGDLLVARLARAASAARDAHGAPEQPRDHGAQAALHAAAASARQRAAIGPSTGPSPARAALARSRRQLSSSPTPFSLQFTLHARVRVVLPSPPFFVPSPPIRASVSSGRAVDRKFLPPFQFSINPLPAGDSSSPNAISSSLQDRSTNRPLVPHITCTHQESTSETGLGGRSSLSLSLFLGRRELSIAAEQDRIQPWSWDVTGRSIHRKGSLKLLIGERGG